MIELLAYNPHAPSEAAPVWLNPAHIVSAVETAIERPIITARIGEVRMVRCLAVLMTSGNIHYVEQTAIEVSRLARANLAWMRNP